MNKFDQLVELIKTGVVLNDAHTGSRQFLVVFPQINNVWANMRSVIDTYEQDVTTMADNYFRYLYNSAPKPEWVSHLGV